MFNTKRFLRSARRGGAAALAVTALFFAAATTAQAQIAIPMVTVGNPDNAGAGPFANGNQAYGGGTAVPDDAFGMVNYTYAIGSNDVTNSQYCAFLNAVAAADPYLCFNNSGAILQTGSPGSYSYSLATNSANKPVVNVTWYDTLRFTNWLDNGQPAAPEGPGTTESGSYLLTAGSANVQSGNESNTADYNAVRNPTASYWLPNEDEWFKSAFYTSNAINGTRHLGVQYNIYATQAFSPGPGTLTGSDSSGNGVHGGSTNFANYGGVTGLTNVGTNGGPSFYGTYDQGGNAWQWTENALKQPDVNAEKNISGGWAAQIQTTLQDQYVYGEDYAASASGGIGFRVAGTVNVITRTTYWTGGGGDGNLSTAGNWNNGLPASGTEMDFGPLGGGQSSASNDVLAWSSSTAAAGIRFLGTADTLTASGSNELSVNSAAYTLSGNAVTLTGPINNDSSSDQVINLPLVFSSSGANAGLINTGSQNITINGLISGQGDVPFTKMGTGTLVLSPTGGNNTYTSASTYIQKNPGIITNQSAAMYLQANSTIIQGGVLQADVGSMPGTIIAGLPSTANLVLDGGVLQNNGQMTSFTESCGTGAGQVQWDTALGHNGSGGFSARNAPLTVNLGGASAMLTWNGTSGQSQYFIGVQGGAVVNESPGILMFGSNTSNDVVTFQNPINLNSTAPSNITGAAISQYTMRTVQVTAGEGGDYTVLSGVISDTGPDANDSPNVAGLVKTGNGLFVLSNTNTYPGTTTISDGTLQLGLSSGSGAQNGVVVGNVIDGAALIFANPQNQTFAPTISGGGTVTKIGAGTLVLDASNTYSGITTINGGILSVGVADTNPTSGTRGTGPLGSVFLNSPGTVVFGGGTLQYSAANNSDYSGRFSTAAGQPISIDTNGQTVTFATPLTSPSGSLAVNDSNGAPGMLILAAAETYTGGTTITGGEIKLNGVAGLLPSLASSASNGLGGALTMSGGTLDLEGTAQTVGALNGHAGAIITDLQTGGGGPGSNGVTPLTVSFDSGSSTFGGSIADGPTAQLSLTKSGAGTLILSGEDSYSGGTSVTAGDLVVTTNTALGGGNLTVAAGATLIFDSTFAGSPVSLSAGPQIAAVPEPGTLALLVSGLAVGFGIWRRRKTTYRRSTMY